jgi:hypothetical protein
LSSIFDTDTCEESKLRRATIKTSKTLKVYQSIVPDFGDIDPVSPSAYVNAYWSAYRFKCGVTSWDDEVFKFILASLCEKEKLFPVHLNAKMLSGPNVVYDLMFYTAERGPICWSVKTSLRERYKQADLEAIALKYVHRKALNYLITLNVSEAKNVKAKIKTGDVIGLDDVIVASEAEFDEMILELKKLAFIEPPMVKVIESNQVITAKKVSLL